MKDAQREAERLLSAITSNGFGGGSTMRAQSRGHQPRPGDGERRLPDDAHRELALWLAAAAARRGAARRVHALAGGRDVWHSFYSTPKAAHAGASSSALDNYRQIVDDPVFWQALGNNLIYAVGTIPLSIALALADGALGQRPHRRPRLPAPGVLHADGAADDRGRQHLAVLLHARIRPARADPRPFGMPAHNWLGSRTPRSAR